MSMRWLVSFVAVAVAGCASIPHQHPTRPPAGRSAADVARDEGQCEAYAKAQIKNKTDYYRHCMVARDYGANVDMSELGWTVGLVQTRPHDVAVVTKDVEFCDLRADNVKNVDVVTLTAEQERSLADPAFAQQRRNASRMLVACLAERGYAVVPWVRFSGR